MLGLGARLACPARFRAACCYTLAPFLRMGVTMIEINPLRHRVADLKARVEGLRGYL